MIDIDNLEKFITDGVAQGDLFSLRKEGWIELLTILRQAEKDAARYRWLRDESAFTHENAPLTFFTDTNGDQIAFHFNGSSYSVLYDEMLDAAIDEAMQCK